ncbi:MAG: hypothetical protein ACOCU1_00935 [Bacillota bacterium]
MKLLYEKVTDPTNPVWIAIYKIYVIGVSVLTVLAGFFLGIAQLFINTYWYSFIERFAQMILMWVAAIFVSAVFYIINMVILNALYNLQKTRVSSELILQHMIQKEDVE